MRGDCRYFQKRMYGSGESMQFCVLGLAPEAPWRCPPGCPRYEKRAADLLARDSRGPEAGSAEVAAAPSEPALAAGAAELLGAAQGILRAAGPEIMAEQERRRRREARSPWWQKLREQARWRRSV
jgi:hypothetical protein